MYLHQAVLNSQLNKGWQFTCPRWSHDDYAIWENDALVLYKRIRSTFREAKTWHPDPADILAEDYHEYEERFIFQEAYALMREGKKLLPLRNREKPLLYNIFEKNKLRRPLQAEDIDDLWIVVE